MVPDRKVPERMAVAVTPLMEGATVVIVEVRERMNLGGVKRINKEDVRSQIGRNIDVV